MRLLIIDDDSISNYINTRMAQTSGLFQEIRSVNNGKEALEVFYRASTGAASAPDMILLDLNMPLMSGFDFIDALQGLNFPGKQMLSIVILTSSDNAVDIERARARGIRYYLVKSITVKDLQDTIFAIKAERQLQMG